MRTCTNDKTVPKTDREWDDIELAIQVTLCSAGLRATVRRFIDPQGNSHFRIEVDAAYGDETAYGDAMFIASDAVERLLPNFRPLLRGERLLLLDAEGEEADIAAYRRSRELLETLTWAKRSRS